MAHFVSNGNNYPTLYKIYYHGMLQARHIYDKNEDGTTLRHSYDF